MTDRNPRVSVVLTTYNGSRFVREAVESVLNQTFTDFELIVVDDGSTDNTVAVVEGYADSRIHLIRNAQNLGISATRNVGIDAARGEFIAAHDHDDISLPQRLEKQVEFLDANPDAVLVGTCARLLKDGRVSDYYEPITEPHLLRWSLFTACRLIHSSVCMRVATLRQHRVNYRQEYHYAEDFDLYHRLADIGALACLPDRLTIYREHGDNASARYRERMTKHGQQFLLEVYRRFLGPEISPEDINRIWTVITSGGPAVSGNDLRLLGGLLTRLLRRFLEVVPLTDGQADDVRRAASETWWRAVCRTAKQHGVHILAGYREFPDLLSAPRSFSDLAQVAVAATLGPKLTKAVAPHLKRLLAGTR